MVDSRTAPAAGTVTADTPLTASEHERVIPRPLRNFRPIGMIRIDGSCAR